MSDERALTTRQPWGSLIMVGVKDVENRSWPVPSTLPQWGRCMQCNNRVPWSSRIARDRIPVHRDARHGWHRRLPPNPPESCGRVLWDDGPFPFRLWIHAGKGIDRDAGYAWDALREVRDAREYQWVHVGDGVHHFSPAYRGVLLGSVLVTGCHPWEDCIAGTAPQGAQGCSPWAEDDAYHWTLTDPQPLPEPIPLKGRQGLWRVPNNAGGFLVGSNFPDTPHQEAD